MSLRPPTPRTFCSATFAQRTEDDLFLDDFCRSQLPALLLHNTRRHGQARKNVLPIKRVKLLMKQDLQDPNLSVTAPAAELMAFAVQAFVSSIIAVACKSTVNRKRRTVALHDLLAAVRASDRFSFLVDIATIHLHQDARALPLIAPHPVPTTFAPQPTPVLHPATTDTQEYAEARAAPLGGVPREGSQSHSSSLASFSDSDEFAPLAPQLDALPLSRSGISDLTSFLCL